MSNVNRNTLSDLNLRDGVSLGMLALLSRARGLDLLQPQEYAEEHTELREYYEPLGIGESNAGIDLMHGKMQRVVLVIDTINYPVAGYPPAYTEREFH